MLSKCANPGCFEVFRYLHQGKIFHLSPTPEVQAAAEVLSPLISERFWLCDTCSQHMTVAWGGTHAKLVSLPSKIEPAESLGPSSEFEPASENQNGRARLRGVAYAGRDDG